MPPTKTDSSGPKNPSDAGRRRVSWPVFLLGAALLACALALYLYGASNSPRTWRDSDNINRSPPAAVNSGARPTPSASPSGANGASGGARPSR